ncbi:hypothetical protein QN400_21760 [Pseudomonas sp. RTC3]|uniref:hypothetical protein n=1 Tax=Pseudomonas sp. 5C2 TaxID=3048588 RepID=UPI002AB52B89|nr:hypothetical protein [Pseudomonas sp. 5C2]MDY7567419.1 hypothetical protein [Pseudomonas sp. 5C2]MEB0064644.1 hypothetical protein [Pseudomonas sp. RTC3]MEB0243151.1 hypothetical protein [Pseudomonas sp. 5C2]
MPISTSTVPRNHVLNGDFAKKFADWTTQDIALIKWAPPLNGHAAIKLRPGVQIEQIMENSPQKTFTLKFNVRASDLKGPDEIGLYGLLLSGRIENEFYLMPLPGIARSEWTSLEYEFTPPVGLLPGFQLVASSASPPKREIYNHKAGEPVFRYTAIEFDSFEVNY